MCTHTFIWVCAFTMTIMKVMERLLTLKPKRLQFKSEQYQFASILPQKCPILMINLMFF